MSERKEQVNPPTPSVNALTAPLLEELVARADELRIKVSSCESGARLVDAGATCSGSLEAGRRIAEICMGGLGRVSLRASASNSHWVSYVDVASSDPVVACLGSQYAGWSLQHGEGKDAFMALGSGPARAIGSKEELFDTLAYRDTSQPCALVLEVESPPPVGMVETIASACGVTPGDLTLILAPTTSLVGAVQVVGRVLEVGLHKAHEIEFPLAEVIDGFATAPLSPAGGQFLDAMGRTNDAIIFGGRVHLIVDSDREDARELAKKLPSDTSPDFGRPFADIFKACNYDFYKVDGLLFSPAEVLVTTVRTGETFQGGKQHLELLQQSFQIQHTTVP